MASNPIKILYVDDDPDDFLLVQTLLRKNKRSRFEIENASTYDEAIQKANGHYDVFLVDYRLGKENGLELLKKLKSERPFIPVIMLTGMEDGDLDNEALEEGASDYLVKGDFDGQTLERTIRYAIRDARLLQTLEVNANRFRNIFERSADPIILIDNKGNILKANPSFIQHFNPEPEETEPGIHSLYSLLVDTTAADQIRSALDQKNELTDFEAILLNGNRQTTDALLSFVLHEAQNNIFQVMIKDLTFLRNKEEEEHNLKKFSSTGRIARILAHEVKNPLTNITLSADQLKNELPEDIISESGDLIDVITRNCERINLLVSQLLDSTRFTELRLKKNSINRLVEEVLELARDSLRLKQVRVETNLDPDICDIEVDADKVKIAILNLVINAIDAMESSTGILTITTRSADEKCFVEISDNGSGISPENMDRLFEPFFTSKKKGTGLGLTNTQNIMLSHKGSIRVRSEPGKGTTFLLSFNMATGS